MEGETDVRFSQALMNTVYGSHHLPDAEFFSCNGKSKIVQIAKALRGVNVPVIAMVDLDIIQNTGELLKLFEILGGNPDDIRLDAEFVKTAVESEKNFLTGRQLNAELDQITENIEPKARVTEQIVGQIRELIKKSSPWLRIKQDGIKGINDALATRALNRLVEASLNHGLIINIEGELEGFCRSIPSNNKSAWLTDVLLRNLKSDPDLADARIFAEKLKLCLEKASG